MEQVLKDRILQELVKGKSNNTNALADALSVRVVEIEKAIREMKDENFGLFTITHGYAHRIGAFYTDRQIAKQILDDGGYTKKAEDLARVLNQEMIDEQNRIVDEAELMKLQKENLRLSNTNLVDIIENYPTTKWQAKWGLIAGIVAAAAALIALFKK